MKSIATTLVVCGLLSILGRSSVFELNADAPSLLTVLNAWQTWLGLSMMLAGAVLAMITEQWKKGHSPLERPNNENGGTPNER